MNFEIVISGPGFNDTGHALRPEMRRTIGTDPTADIQLAAPEGAVVAGRHIVLWNDGTACRLATDGGAVTLNGRPFAKGREARLADGDVIELGPWRLRISALEILGTDEFEEILTKPFGTTRDKAVMTPALDPLHPPKPKAPIPRNPDKTDPRDFTKEQSPPKPVAPKPPPRPKTVAPKQRPLPSSPDEFVVPPHLRADYGPDEPKPKPEPKTSVKPADKTRTKPKTPPASSPISDAARLSRPSTGFFGAPSLRPPSLQDKIERKRPPRVTTPIPDDWNDDAPATPPRPASPKADRNSVVAKSQVRRSFGQYTSPDIGRQIGTGESEASVPPEVKAPAVAPRGHALFRVPRLMWAEIAELAELRLGHGDPMTVAMRAELERTMVGRGETTDEHPVARMGNRMQARLFGDDRYFSITALGSETQDIAPGETAEWDWRVTPLCEGHGLLTLRLTMLADIEGNAVTVDAEALHTSVEITVKSFFTRPRRFVRDNWRWMLGSSGIGAAAALYALLRGT